MREFSGHAFASTNLQKLATNKNIERHCWVSLAQLTTNFEMGRVYPLIWILTWNINPDWSLPGVGSKNNFTHDKESTLQHKFYKCRWLLIYLMKTLCSSFWFVHTLLLHTQHCRFRPRKNKVQRRRGSCREPKDQTGPLATCTSTFAVFSNSKPTQRKSHCRENRILVFKDRIILELEYLAGTHWTHTAISNCCTPAVSLSHYLKPTQDTSLLAPLLFQRTKGRATH